MARIGLSYILYGSDFSYDQCSAELLNVSISINSKICETYSIHFADLFHCPGPDATFQVVKRQIGMLSLCL